VNIGVDEVTRPMVLTEFLKLLRGLDRKNYGAYRRLKNIVVDYKDFNIKIVHVQGDPHAPPSFVEVTIHRDYLKVLEKAISLSRDVTPVEDFVYRALFKLLKRYSRRCGSGNSCYLGVPKPSPCMLRRSGVELNKVLLLRFFLGLPAKDRRVYGDQAVKLFADRIPRIVKELMTVLVNSEKRVLEIAKLYRDQEYVRGYLYKEGLVAFVADGSILPRESSISEKPLQKAVPFRSPKSMRITIKLPSGKSVSGMGIPLGVVVLTGGGYHGKSTLLRAIQRGVYNHVKGDGREFVIAREAAVSVMAEDGRIIHNVDISSFVEEDPYIGKTSSFSTLNASGSTSMAASLSEAVEMGAELILIDEDNSATNMLFKDSIMEKIIPDDPLKPLSLQIRSLVEKSNAGIVVISGSSSAFLCRADRVVRMRMFLPEDITDYVRKFVGVCEDTVSFSGVRMRVFKGVGGVKRIRSRGMRLRIHYTDGVEFELDLARNPRIVEEGQVRLIAAILRRLVRENVHTEMSELVKYIDEELGRRGFKAFKKPVSPDLTWVRGIDVAWVLNRLYRARFEQVPTRNP